jgi:hypothetical protein
MNKIFLVLLGIMSLNLIQASGHEFNWSNPRLVSEFIEKDLMTRNERGTLDAKRPIDKAIFVAIRNGADHDFVQALLTRSYKTSKSKAFDNYMEAEIKSAYRSYSPTVIELKDKIFYAQKAAQRVQLEKDLERFQNFYK